MTWRCTASPRCLALRDRLSVVLSVKCVGPFTFTKPRCFRTSRATQSRGPANRRVAPWRHLEVRIGAGVLRCRTTLTPGFRTIRRPRTSSTLLATLLWTNLERQDDGSGVGLRLAAHSLPHSPPCPRITCPRSVRPLVPWMLTSGQAKVRNSLTDFLPGLYLRNAVAHGLLDCARIEQAIPFGDTKLIRLFEFSCGQPLPDSLPAEMSALVLFYNHKRVSE